MNILEPSLENATPSGRLSCVETETLAAWVAVETSNGAVSAYSCT